MQQFVAEKAAVISGNKKMDEMRDKILKKLESMHKRYVELDELIVKPEVMQDNARYTSYLKEHGGLLKINDKYMKLSEAVKQKGDAEAIVADKDGDPELQELAGEELNELTETVDALFKEIRSLFVSENKESMKNVIAEIRAGTGGDEAALFAANLYRMYSRMAEDRGWKIEVFDSNPTGIGGLKEITFSIEGAGAYRMLRYESGTHRVQRVPETEASGRIHTSTATVAILPEVESVEIDINPNDLEIDTFRSSGPGGQKVNKTSSAIRINHKPTGLVVKCQDEKSQHKNKAKAMRILRSRLYEHFESQKHSERAVERKSQIGTGERSEKIRTYNYPQNRVTDHRINLDLFDLTNILDGSIDGLTDNLRKDFEEEQFKRLIEEA